VLVQEDHKVEDVFRFFNERHGTPVTRSHVINLDDLDVPHLDLFGLGNRFTEEEVWGVI
jgi:hypothetical protein